MNIDEKNTLSRRSFLERTTQTMTATTILQAIGTLGVAISTSGCGSSSASENPIVGVNRPPPRAASPRPADWPDNIGLGKQVLILGAGIAGLVSAIEMEKLGYSCTILEATDRVGGRVRTIRNGDIITETDSSQTCLFDNDPSLYFNVGAARIPNHHDLLLGYCREFNVGLEIFVNENQSARMHSTTTNGSAPLVTRQVENDSRGYIGELLANAINQGALDSELSTSDKSNMLGLVRQFAGLDASYNYQGTSRSGFPGQENSNSRSRDELLTPIDRSSLLQSEFWQFKLDFFKQINQQATMLQPVGGMDSIPQAFRQQIISDIIYQAEVTQISKTGNGVQITYRNSAGLDTSLDADYCICTIPATVLKDIANDFSAAHQSEITNFSYSRAGKLAFQSERFWEVENNIFGGISWTDQDITQLWYPSAAPGSAQGVIVGGYTFGSAQGDRFSAQSVTERITNGINQASQIHSDYANQVFNGISISWPKVPFQLGGWGNSAADILLTEDENVFFAGEHLSILQGWQEGAILSAYWAIDLIVAKDTL